MEDTSGTSEMIITAKRQAIDAMLASQLPGSDHQKSFLSQAAMETGAGGKEAVLRKLLETQNGYIKELEAKCKSMMVQLRLSSAGGGDSNDDYFERYDGGQLSSGLKKPHGQGPERVDLVELENSELKTAEKLHDMILVIDSVFKVPTQSTREGPSSSTFAQEEERRPTEYSHPIASNLIAALQIVINQVNLEEQVTEQRTQQHASLISAMQERFQKERDEHRALLEKSELALEQKILSLEQEIIVYKQHVRTISQDEQTRLQKQELNAGVLEQIENLESKYRQSEEELRQQNRDLRSQLQEAQLKEREATNEVQSLRQTFMLAESDQFTCLKRIEGQMKVIFKEFKSAQSKLLTSSQNDSGHEKGRIEKTLTALNKQIQALDDELEQEFDSIVSLQSTQHKQELLGSRSENQLQILLRDAERENLHLRQLMQAAELSEQEKTQSVWLHKLDICNNEKKAIEAELKNLVDISARRETMLSKENAHLVTVIEHLKQTSQEREEVLLNEIAAIKERMTSLMEQMRQNGNSLSQSVLQGTPEAQKIARDISSQYSTANISLIEGRDHELQLLRNLNENLQRQLKEANQLLGRSNTFEKQNTIGLIYNKLEVRLQDLVKQVTAAFSNLAETIAKQLNTPEESLTRVEALQKEQEHCEKELDYEKRLFEEKQIAEELRGELAQAKLCLVQQIQLAQQSSQKDLASESDSGADQNLIDVLVSKFSTEIERLKSENSQLKLQRDNVTTFYKEEFAKVWERCQDQIRNCPSAREKQNVQKRREAICEVVTQLEEQFSELKAWIQSLRVEEIKALHEKVNQLHTKQLHKNATTTPRTSSSRLENKKSAAKLAEGVSASALADAANLARIESNFSFNHNAAVAQRSMLYEEIEILSEQVAQFQDSYARATKSRDVQFQILAKERNILRQREALLDATMVDAIAVITVSDENERRRADWQRQNELQEAEHLRRSYDALLDRFKSEKEANEKELEHVQSSYQEKFVQLKESETLLEVQLAQLDKDLQASQDNLRAIREQKDDTVQSLNVEIANLKKFANQRQVELLEARRQVTLFYKKTKETMATKEAEMKRSYRDQVGSHVRVLEIELKRLEKSAELFAQKK